MKNWSKKNSGKFDFFAKIFIKGVNKAVFGPQLIGLKIRKIVPLNVQHLKLLTNIS